MPESTRRNVMSLIVVTLALLVINVISARADNYGGVSRAEYNRNAAAVYTTFASVGGSWVGRQMVRCMNRESGGNRLAANWGDSNGGSFGLLQLNGAHRWRKESRAAFRARMWNVKTHLEAAKRLYQAARRAYGNGFQPWGGGC